VPLRVSSFTDAEQIGHPHLGDKAGVRKYPAPLKSPRGGILEQRVIAEPQARWAERRRPLATAALVALLLLLTGCAGGSSATSNAVAVSTAASGPVTPTGAADGVQQSFIDVIGKVSPSVVEIRTPVGLGSGVVFDGNGHVVTNAHVVGSSTTFEVTSADGKTYKATLVSTFPQNDVAVIKVENPSGLPAATFADSDKVKVGEIVLAIGNPLGLQSSVTNGIVSALGRTLSEPNGATLPRLIQTSAPINPGNSGGALVDLTGAVVGIPTLAATNPNGGGGAAPGIGFAIPSNDAADFAQQMIEHGKVINTHRAYLGIEIAQINAPGVLVAGVAKGGPADKAGIRPGEIITAINGQPTPTLPALGAVLAQLNPGDTVKVTLRDPNGGTRTVSVTLAQMPGSLP
jgi:S1-C subfamily serine protease